MWRRSFRRSYTSILSERAQKFTLKLSLIRPEKLNSELLSVDLNMTGPTSVLFENVKS